MYRSGVTHILNVAYGVPNTFPEVGMYDMVSHTYLMWLMVSPTLSLRWVCMTWCHTHT